MNRFIFQIIIISSIFLWLPLLTTADELNITLETHSLQCLTKGTGSPVVILDIGFGETFDQWMPVINKLSEQTQVFAYNRAGYGKSEPGPLPRDAKQEAFELKDLLNKAGIKSPYILLGHSLGGLNLQILAYFYPEKTKALVLLDPPPIAWLTGDSFPELKKMAMAETEKLDQASKTGINSDDPDKKKNAQFLKMLASEHKQLFENSAKQVSSIKSFNELMLIVIGAENPNPLFGEQAEAYQEFWINENRLLSKKSSNGKFILAENSSHHINKDRPDIVIKTVLDIINNIK